LSWWKFVQRELSERYAFATSVTSQLTMYSALFQRTIYELVTSGWYC
jgi:hypothetical protein